MASAAQPSLPDIPKYALTRTTSPATNNVIYSQEIAQIQILANQLNALKTTPRQIIAAPTNVGECIIVESICLNIQFGTTAYTLNAGTLKLFYGVVANAHPIIADQSAILTRTSSGAIVNLPPTAIASDSYANSMQQAIFVGNDGAANYTLGDGLLTVTVIFNRTTP